MRSYCVVTLLLVLVSVQAKLDPQALENEVPDSEDSMEVEKAGEDQAEVISPPFMVDGGGLKPRAHRERTKKHKEVLHFKKSKHLSKKLWSKLKAKYKKTEEPHEVAACANLMCKKKHFCMINVESGQPECVTKKMLKGRKNKKHALKDPRKEKDESAESSSDESDNVVKLKKLKLNAKLYADKHEKKMHKKLEKLMHHGRDMKEERRRSKKEKGELMTQNSAEVKMSQTCSHKELREMGRRLLDWFKLLQDQATQGGDNSTIHQIAKRNSMKKDLHEDGECVCQAPVMWEFIQLDKDSDAQISLAEMDGLEKNGFEHCVTPFVDACDHDRDATLSEREWCCCFANVLPPCLAAQQKIPTDSLSGEEHIMPGALVPECDDDGFYMSMQCHGSTGYCWCVDRNGQEVENTRTRSTLECDKILKDLEDEKNDL